MHLLPHVSISLLPYFVPTYGKDHSLSQRGEEGIHFLPCALRRISVRPPQEEEQLYSNIPGSQGRMVWEMLPAPPRSSNYLPPLHGAVLDHCNKTSTQQCLRDTAEQSFPSRAHPSSDPILSQHCHVAGHGKHEDCVQEVKTEALSAELAI